MKLRLTGIGEHDHDLALGKLALLIGENGSGKTKVHEALRLVALGYSPTFGKRPQDTATLMRGTRMEVVCDPLDDGRQVTFGCRAKGTGYSAATKASWLDDKKSSSDQHRAATMELFGRSEAEVAELMNVRALTHCSESQRAARIEQLLESTFDHRRALWNFGRSATLRLTGRLEDPPRDHRELRPMIPGYSDEGEHESQYAVLVAAADEVAKKLKDLGVGGAFETMKRHRLDAQAETRKLRHSVETAEERARDLPEIGEGEMAELERRREELDRAIGGIDERLVDVRRAAHRVSEAEKLIARKEGEVEAARKAREEYEAGAADVDAKRARIEECSTDIEALREKAAEQPTAPVGEMVAELSGVEMKVSSMKLPDVDELRRRLARMKQAHGADPWLEVASIAGEIVAHVDMSKATKAAKESVRGLTDRLVDLADEHSSGEELPSAEAIAALEDEVEQADAEAAKLAELEEQAKNLRGRIQAVRDEHALRTAQLQKRIHDLMGERDDLRNVVADLGAGDTRTAAAVERAEEDLKAAKRRLAEIRGEGNDDAAELEKQAEPLREKLAEVKARLKTLQDAKSRRDELDRLHRDLLRAEDAATVYSACERALEQVRADEINQGGGTLIAVMREFLAAAGREETPIIKADFLGWVKGGDDAVASPVAVKAISDGEFCLFAAALNAALVIAQGAEVRPLLIEADSASDATMAQLLAGIEAVADRLTTVIVARWARPAEVPEGWQVIEFGADGSVREAA